MPDKILDSMENMRAKRYLGDGLYVAWDGLYVWLMAERDGRVHSVAIESLAGVERYFESIKKLAAVAGSMSDVPEEL